MKFKPTNSNGILVRDTVAIKWAHTCEQKHRPIELNRIEKLRMAHIKHPGTSEPIGFVEVIKKNLIHLESVGIKT